MGLLGRLLPDPKCTRCGRTYAACICHINPTRAITQRQPRERPAPKRKPR